MTEDTICAIATPKGMGGIAVIRISGSQSIEIASKIWKGKDLKQAKSHTVTFGTIVDPDNGDVIDDGLATIFRHPKSYTGEDTVEISVHGSEWIQRELLQLLVRMGCRMAMPGEYTRRAFASGNLDLTEAEAVADLIASSSRTAHRIAIDQMRGTFSNELKILRAKLIDLSSLLELELDFSEENVEFASRQKLHELSSEIHATLSRLTESFAVGSALKDGIPVAIVGETNAGKSTLLNRLLNEERAIVSNVHGTTRDTIEDTMTIDGTLFRLIDTAGLRETDDPIEAIGISRTEDKIRKARIIMWVIDPTSDTPVDTLEDRIFSNANKEASILAIINKMDLISGTQRPTTDMLPKYIETISMSALSDNDINSLKTKLSEISGAKRATSGETLITNVRHYEGLLNAQNDIQRVVKGIEDGISGDFIAQDLRSALHNLGEITGEINTPTILSSIFSRFCVGK